MKTVFPTKFLLPCALAAAFSFTNVLAQTAPAAPQTPPPAQTQPAQQAQPNGQPPAVQPANGQTPDDKQYTITTSANEVDLVFTVTDKHGRFIKDLKQSDFALLDDQKAPAQIFSFTQETNLPLRVGIVIDTSTSIRQRFQFEQQAAAEFLFKIVRPQSDKAFVMGFDVTPDYKQDWTNNLDSLNGGINALRSGGAPQAQLESIAGDSCFTPLGNDYVMVAPSNGNPFVLGGDSSALSRWLSGPEAVNGRLRLPPESDCAALLDQVRSLGSTAAVWVEQDHGPSRCERDTDGSAHLDPNKVDGYGGVIVLKLQRS